MTLPLPPKEVPVCTSTMGLAPRFRAALSRTLQTMRSVGFDPVIAETTRSPERQQFLYGFGRDYDDGRGVVTNARDVAHTWHGYGLAADVISQSHGWDALQSFWDALRACAEDEGLVSGASWPTFADKPHVQWGVPMRRSPSAHAAELLAERGASAVWSEVGCG